MNLTAAAVSILIQDVSDLSSKIDKLQAQEVELTSQIKNASKEHIQVSEL